MESQDVSPERSFFIVGLVTGIGFSALLRLFVPALFAAMPLEMVAMGTGFGLLLVAHVGVRMAQAPLWLTLLAGQLCALAGLVMLLVRLFL
jgi:hypothetical protein